MRVVVIGGSGNVGARICRRLARESSLEIIATGRRLADSRDSAISRKVLDLHAPDFTQALATLSPDVVIHCAGPFQGQDYNVAAAAIACGAHYIDLADGREFVVQFAARNHDAALRADRIAVTGASTLPALSSAVVDHLRQRIAHIEEIDITIAPGQHAPRGIATMTAVLGYAGRGFKWWEDGEWRTAYGWQELRRVRFPFGTRHAAACDVPDLTLFPERYPGLRTAVFRAALEIPLQQYALWCVAALRRLGIPFPTERWAAPLNRAAGWFDRFGSDRGGMSVIVSGKNESGQPRRATWQVVAESNHGPEIPCMAAILLTTKLAAGESFPPGARPCMGMLTLCDFESEFARWDMRSSIEEA
jgi:saccharopine dehydrogenase-like NADP-dependent oxidoreductase